MTNTQMKSANDATKQAGPPPTQRIVNPSQTKPIQAPAPKSDDVKK